MQTQGHLNEVFLEEYARNKVHASDTSALFRHLATCPSCQTAFEEMQEFVAFLASDSEETAGHIHQRHATAGGTVFLVVSGSDASGRWDARVLGAGHEQTRAFSRGDDAKDWVACWFERHFPDHLCSDDCGGGWV